jgi:hypothetical protein
MRIYILWLFRFVLLHVSSSNIGGSTEYIDRGFFLSLLDEFLEPYIILIHLAYPIYLIPHLFLHTFTDFSKFKIFKYF